MSKRIGCLHAHYSNIGYIEQALSSYDVQLNHFVDPGLMQRVVADESFTELDAQKKVKEQIEWIAQTGVEAILITCTNYIALLDQMTVDVPIIKIDEPFFEAICKHEQHQTMLFTNPDTVTGTMNRLEQYAKLHQKRLDIEVLVIEDTFDLIMSGKHEAYQKTVYDFIMRMDRLDHLSVAQLSMVAAAQQVEDETSIAIINPLNTLVSSIVNQLNLQKAEQR